MPISLQPAAVKLWHFKFRLSHLTEFIVWNIKSLQPQPAKVKGLEIQMFGECSILFVLLFVLHTRRVKSRYS